MTLNAEDRFARVVEAVSSALVLAGPTGLIEMVNRQAEHMFGYDHEELRNQPFETLLPERSRPLYAELRDHFLTVGSADPSGHTPSGQTPDLYGIRKDGTEFPLEIGLGLIDRSVLANIADITVRHRIDAENEAQRAELARSNSDLEEFAYVASHDLKAPLRAVSHLVGWIAEDIGDNASVETAANLTLLRGRVERLRMLLDGLLAYARIGRTPAVFEAVDIAKVVHEVVSVLSPPPGFTIACEGEMPPLRTHRTSLMVVLQNLIGNAINHHDRANGHIAVSMRMDNGIAEFRVSDNGPGIASRFHERIFVIFQTLASRDDVESSGIGLAIVKKRVEGHGGRIWVESEPPERGTTFVFTWKEQAA
jgi:PAS domain S-box-containing protein